MKRLLIVLLWLNSVTVVFSQTTVFNENFELPGLDDSMTYLSTPTAGTSWSINSRLHYGATSLRSDSCQVKMGTTIYMITNSFSTIGSSNVLLTFDQICKVHFMDIATIEVSNNGGTNWTQLTGSQYLGVGVYTTNGNRFATNSYGSLWVPSSNLALPLNTWWKSETFDVSALLANTLQAKVRFKLTDGGNPGPEQCKGWYIDNIKVSGNSSELIPPQIILVNPVMTGETHQSGPYAIKARITDQSGIDTAMLIYNANGSPNDTLGMIHLGGDTMIAWLPAVTDSTVFCWKVRAVDDSPANNVALVPTSACNQMTYIPGVPIPYINNFESGLPSWTPGYGGSNTQTSWQLGTPNYGVTNSAHSLPNAWDVNLNSVCQPDAFCILTTPWFDFSNTVDAIMEFWVNYRLGEDYEGVRMEYSANGGIWQLLGSPADPIGTNWYDTLNTLTGLPVWNGFSEGWKKCSYSLSQFNNYPHQIQFRFVFTTFFSLNSDGFSIDDFRIIPCPTQQMGLISVLSPSYGGYHCGMGLTPVTIRIRNTGSNAISGSITAGYQRSPWVPVFQESFNLSLPVNGYYDYTFSTPADLSVAGGDSIYFLKTWVHLIDDPDHQDDTLYRKIDSRFLPPSPVVSNVSVPFATDAILNVPIPYYARWYDAPVGGTLLSNQNQYHTPLLYQTTVYYVCYHSGMGCVSDRVPDTVFVQPEILPPYDAGIIGINSPLAICLEGTALIPSISITNNGSQPISNLVIGYYYDSFPAITLPWTGSLLTHDTLEFAFPQASWPVGDHQLQFFCQLLGDTISYNDTLSIGFRVIPHHQLPYECDFETFNDFWEEHVDTTEWALGQPNGHHWPFPVPSPNHVWATCLDKEKYGPNANTSLCTGSFDFQNTTNTYLSFKFAKDLLNDWVRFQYSAFPYTFWNTIGTFGGSNQFQTYFPSPITGTWSSDKGPQWLQQRFPLDLDQSSVMFRFLLVSDEAYEAHGMAIDDFEIKEALPEDVAIESATPDGILNVGETLNVGCTLRNLGNSYLSSLNFGYMLNGQVIEISPWDTCSGCGPGFFQTFDYLFNIPFIVPNGLSTLKVFSMLPGDDDPYNDTLTIYLFGKYPCQEVISALDAQETSPPPNNSSIIALCPLNMVTFSGKGMYPENNQYYQQTDNSSYYYWDFGDGTRDEGKTVTHSYTQPGEYLVRLIVRDNNLCFSEKQIVARVNVGSAARVETGVAPQVCAGTALTLTAGTGSDDFLHLTAVHFFNPDIEIMTYDTSGYIPDGGAAADICYERQLQVTTADPSAVISDAEQVKAVVVNMEHSYTGDLGMRITCPNGQYIRLKEWYSGGAYLGMPLWGIDHDLQDCISTPACRYDPLQNPQGQGWTYSFSEDAVYSKLQDYAQTGNCLPPDLGAHMQIDSGSYLSHDPFSGLVGCPVNGTWTLKVCDQFITDNGWIKWWQLHLADSIMPQVFSYDIPVDSIHWSGPGIVDNSSMSAQIQVVVPGTYSYDLQLFDSIGCITDTTITLQFPAGLEVQPGPDQTYLSPSSALLFCNPEGGTPPYSCLWSNGDQGLTISVFASTTATYTMTVTDAMGCTGVDSIKVTIGGCPEIEGTLTYHNAVSTPMNDVVTSLFFSNNNLADTLTNLTGSFVFTELCQPGDYSLGFSCSKPHHGCNSIDALFALKSFVGMITLSPLEASAADVNASGTITAVDALTMMKRFVGMIDSFPVGDWVFDEVSLTLGQGESGQVAAQALCSGDVNGSHIPGLREEPAIQIKEFQVTVEGRLGVPVLIPVYAKVNSHCGSLSLIMDFDSRDIQILDVKPVSLETNQTDQFFIYHSDNQQLRVAWVNASGQAIDETVPIFFITVLLNENTDYLFTIANGSSMTDEQGGTLQDAKLLLPRLNFGGVAFGAFLYPNPASDVSNLMLMLPHPCEIEVTLSNAYGQELSLISRSHAEQTDNEIPLDLSQLNAGVYFVRITCSSCQSKEEKNIRLIKR